MTNHWNAKIYSQFLDVRTRPAKDLLAAFPLSFQPNSIYDLGCGPGNSTILLKERWPGAQVVGIDSSADMLKEAKANYPHITFIQQDIAHFAPTEKIDCLFANASLQWLPHHETLIPQLLQFLKPHGAFGIQMPNNFHSPTHQTTIQLLQHNPTWQPLLKNLRYGILNEPEYKITWYYELLVNAGASQVQCWETDYFPELDNHQAIFEWVAGTALRPVLTAMDANNKTQFRDAYIQAISKKYPIQSNGKILLPYKRLFLVGFKN